MIPLRGIFDICLHNLLLGFLNNFSFFSVEIFNFLPLTSYELVWQRIGSSFSLEKIRAYQTPFIKTAYYEKHVNRRAIFVLRRISHK